MQRICLSSDAAAAVDEYLLYNRIVGEDDGGKLFTPEEYEEYKKKVLPARLMNRLYVSWGVPSGMDCKLVGPETPCFCNHRYKQHKTDFEEIPKDRPVLLPCRVRGCQCASYNFVPQNGSQTVRCRCKHFPHEHSETGGYKCKKCSNCTGFHSPFTCGCGQPASAHETIVETREERLARGRPVGKSVPYAAMGGLTGFSSLAEGYMRLDDSGIGAPSMDLLDTPGGAIDNMFIQTFNRQNSPTCEGKNLDTKAQETVCRRISEEEDMAFFERRYQERLKMEKMAKQQKASNFKGKLPNRVTSQPKK
ncbi:protein FAM221A [Polypterus senegalus]|uniref:protein FAM221A n=1 Tax=Polypterus senegalus TaxID=55291 RepID=UPI0019626F09|nr:protein FAM221A [Polypterus senegalus]